MYPAGAFRPEQGVQRGSVMDMPIHPGDPLTPGWAASPARKKLARTESATILKIPVLPISYGDALPLLKALNGTGGAGGVARRAADHVSRRPGPGEGAREARVRLAEPAAPQRHRPDRGLGVPRRVDHLRQPSRRVGQRRRRSDERRRRADGNGARPRGAAEDRLAAEAHDHPRAVGWRGMGAARLDRVGREARRRAARQGRRLHQHRQHRQRLAERRRLARAAADDERGGPRGDRSAHAASRWPRKRGSGR